MGSVYDNCIFFHAATIFSLFLNIKSLPKKKGHVEELKSSPFLLRISLNLTILNIELLMNRIWSSRICFIRSSICRIGGTHIFYLIQICTNLPSTSIEVPFVVRLGIFRVAQLENLIV